MSPLWATRALPTGSQPCKLPLAWPGLDDRQKRIELAAYYRAERRGFTPGHELEDWLEAESEVE